MSKGLYSKKSSTLSGNRSKQKDKKFNVYDFFSSESHSEEDDSQFQQRKMHSKEESPTKNNLLNTLYSGLNQKLRAITIGKDKMEESSAIDSQKKSGINAVKRVSKILQNEKSDEEEFIPFSSQFESAKPQGSAQQLTIHDVLDQTYQQEMSIYEKDHPFEGFSQSSFSNSLAIGAKQQSSQAKVKFINFKDQLYSDDSESNLRKRPTNQKLLSSTKEMFQFKLAKLEDRIKKKVLEEEKLKIKKIKIMDLQSKSNFLNPLACMRDKLKGKFNLCLREDLSMRLKVANFAQEPLSFHIHKNRHMFPKLLELEQRRLDKIKAEKERQKLEKQGSQLSLGMMRENISFRKLDIEELNNNREKDKITLSKGAFSVSNMSQSPKRVDDRSNFLRRSAVEIKDFSMAQALSPNYQEIQSALNLNKFGSAVIDLKDARKEEKKKSRALRLKSQRFNLKDLGVSSSQEDRKFLFSSQEGEHIIEDKQQGLLSVTPRKIEKFRIQQIAYGDNSASRINADLLSHEAQGSTEQSLGSIQQNNPKVKFPQTQHASKRSHQFQLNRRAFNLKDIQEKHSSQIYAKPSTSHFASLTNIINHTGGMSTFSPLSSQRAPHTIRQSQVQLKPLVPNQDLIFLKQSSQERTIDSLPMNHDQSLPASMRSTSLDEKQIGKKLRFIMKYSAKQTEDINSTLQTYNKNRNTIAQKISKVFQISDFFQDIECAGSTQLQRLYHYKKSAIEQEKEEAQQVVFSYKTGENDYSRMHAKMVQRTFKKEDISKKVDQSKDQKKLEKKLNLESTPLKEKPKKSS